MSITPAPPFPFARAICSFLVDHLLWNLYGVIMTGINNVRSLCIVLRAQLLTHTFRPSVTFGSLSVYMSRGTASPNEGTERGWRRSGQRFTRSSGTQVPHFRRHKMSQLPGQDIALVVPTAATAARLSLQPPTHNVPITQVVYTSPSKRKRREDTRD